MRIKTFAAAAATAFALVATPAVAQTATVTLTSGHHALSTMPAKTFGKVQRNVQTIRVNDRIRYQQVTGFGAAMTDSSAWLISQLPAAERTRVMQALARVENYVRVPVGSSDFTHDGQMYSYDDMPAGQTDPSLSRFSIAHDLAYIIPILRQVRKLNPSTEFFGSAWSGPAWMKANDALNNPTWDSGDILPSYYGTYATYLAKFVQTYAQQGVPMAAITPGNELGWTTMYSGMGIKTDDMPGFVQNDLAPAIHATGLGTKVYDGDSGCCDYEIRWQQQVPGYARSISGTAVHCYGGLGPMSQLHAVNPSEQIIESECSPGIIGYSPAETAIASMRNWATAVELWNVALDSNGGPKVQAPGCTGCSGLVTIDGQHAHLNANYYGMAQVSEFVKRGAHRIASTRFVTDVTDHSAVTPGVDNVAFVNPNGSKVMVAYNSASHPVRFQVAAHGKGFEYTLAAGGTVTFQWR